MNAAEAITAGMCAQRHRDWQAACRGRWGYEHVHRMQAWLWWGWHLNRSGGLGKPGRET